MTDPIQAVAVVIPVHDEEHDLPACLDAVSTAIALLRDGAPRMDVAAWVVLDACTDASEQIAAASGLGVVHVRAGSVGAARRAGVDAALARTSTRPVESVWLAHTDADSVVPPHWLTHQVGLADAGADVVVGTVRPDFRHLDARRSAAWWSRYTPGVANGHVHGANLGTRASTLLAAGGFEEIAEHEDVRLVSRMREGAAAVIASDGAWVRTSARLEGRTPGGYARYLRDDLARDPVA